MRTLSLFMCFCAILTWFGSCDGGPVQMNATGIQSEIVVVMDKKYWDGQAGSILKNVLREPVPGLPQIEPSLTISSVTPQGFDKILKVVRNILIVEIDPSQYTKSTIKLSKDKWARNQLVMRIQSPDPASFELFITQNAHEIVSVFVDEELKRIQEHLKKVYNHDAQVKLKEMFDIEMSIPEGMKFSRDTTDFFWITNDANSGRRDIIVYSFPYTDKDTFTKDYLVAMRDSVLKANLPGAFPGSYMSTEKRFGPEYKALNINGKYVGELRGLWRMEGDQMGGPFVSHARLDEKNNRVIVAEGFVYAPETKKRNHIRQVEAPLYTLRLSGDSIAGDKDVSAEKE